MFLWILYVKIYMKRGLSIGFFYIIRGIKNLCYVSDVFREPLNKFTIEPFNKELQRYNVLWLTYDIL